MAINILHFVVVDTCDRGKGKSKNKGTIFIFEFPSIFLRGTRAQPHMIFFFRPHAQRPHRILQYLTIHRTCRQTHTVTSGSFHLSISVASSPTKHKNKLSLNLYLKLITLFVPKCLVTIATRMPKRQKKENDLTITVPMMPNVSESRFHARYL